MQGRMADGEAGEEKTEMETETETEREEKEKRRGQNRVCQRKEKRWKWDKLQTGEGGKQKENTQKTEKDKSMDMHKHGCERLCACGWIHTHTHTQLLVTVPAHRCSCLCVSIPLTCLGLLRRLWPPGDPSMPPRTPEDAAAKLRMRRGSNIFTPHTCRPKLDPTASLPSSLPPSFLSNWRFPSEFQTPGDRPLSLSQKLFLSRNCPPTLSPIPPDSQSWAGVWGCLGRLGVIKTCTIYSITGSRTLITHSEGEGVSQRGSCCGGWWSRRGTGRVCLLFFLPFHLPISDWRGGRWVWGGKGVLSECVGEKQRVKPACVH